VLAGPARPRGRPAADPRDAQIARLRRSPHGSRTGPGLGVRALGDRLQGATTLQGETLLKQPDRRMHRTGLACTSLHRFRARAIFYPNFYPKVQQSGAEMLYVLGRVAGFDVFHFY
jgi:hypothetical protein